MKYVTRPSIVVCILLLLACFSTLQTSPKQLMFWHSLWEGANYQQFVWIHRHSYGIKTDAYFIFVWWIFEISFPIVFFKNGGSLLIHLCIGQLHQQWLMLIWTSWSHMYEIGSKSVCVFHFKNLASICFFHLGWLKASLKGEIKK